MASASSAWGHKEGEEFALIFSSTTISRGRAEHMPSVQGWTSLLQPFLRNNNLIIFAAPLVLLYSLSTAHVLKAGNCLPEFCKTIINCYMLFWARKKKKEEETVEQMKVSRMIWVQAGGILSAGSKATECRSELWRADTALEEQNALCLDLCHSWQTNGLHPPSFYFN